MIPYSFLCTHCCNEFYEVSDWRLEVSIQSFVLNFKVSDQSFEVREAHLVSFDCKVIKLSYLQLDLRC